jgi:hypothetical protein
MVKRSLRGRDVSPDHFSSGTKTELTFSRFAVRIIEGQRLLATDMDTGKSDPVCFVWCGMKDEKSPEWSKITEDNAEEYRVVLTEVCKTTCNPNWNEDLTFPLEVQDITQLENMKCIIYVRDEDRDANDAVSYEDLGMIEFNLDEFMKEGRALTYSIVKSAAWYDLKRSPGMKNVDGSLKLTVSIIFAQSDVPSIIEQLAPEKKDMPNISCGRLVQDKVKGKLTDPNVTGKFGSTMDSPASGKLTPSTPTTKKKAKRPHTAPMLKTASLMSSNNSRSILEESDEIIILDDPKRRSRDYDNDDLVSEPSYDNVISQLKNHGRVPSQRLPPTILEEEENEHHQNELSDLETPQVVPQPWKQISMKELANIAERADKDKVIRAGNDREIQKQQQKQQQQAPPQILKQNSKKNMNRTEENKQKIEELDGGSEHTQEQLVNELDLLDQPQGGDQFIMEHIVNMGVQQISEALANADFGDAIQDTAEVIGKGVLQLGKDVAKKAKLNVVSTASSLGRMNGGDAIQDTAEGIGKGVLQLGKDVAKNAKLNVLSTASSLGGMNGMKEALLSSLDKLTDKISNFDVETSYEGKKGNRVKPSKAKLNIVTNSALGGGSGLNSTKEALLSSPDKLADKISDFEVETSYEGKKGNRVKPSSSYDNNLLLGGPTGGDHLENVLGKFQRLCIHFLSLFDLFFFHFIVRTVSARGK